MGKKERKDSAEQGRLDFKGKLAIGTVLASVAFLALTPLWYNKPGKNEQKPAAVKTESTQKAPETKQENYERNFLLNYPLESCPLRLSFTGKKVPSYDTGNADTVVDYGMSDGARLIAQDFPDVEINIPSWQVTRQKIVEGGRASTTTKYWYPYNKVKPNPSDSLYVEMFGLRNGKETLIYKGNVTMEKR